MLNLIIEDDEGRKTVVPFVRDEITIGRQEGNTIRLTERNVSRRHARLVRLNGHVVVEDLGSYNGTRINGERIAGQSPLKEGDLVQIGDYDLALQAAGAANAAAGPITTKVPARRQEPEPEEEAPPEDDAPEEDEEQDEEAAGGSEEHTPPASAADKRRHATSIIRIDQVEADRPRKVEDIAAEDAPRLLVISPDELKGQEFACIRTELRIGRTDDNDITLDHRSLSRTHAKVVREQNGDWRVIDMQSANGLTVNGESYAQATLTSGDVIEMGHVKLRFVAVGDSAALGASGGGKRSKLPLVAAFLALVLVGAGGAYWFAGRGDKGPGKPQPPPVATDTDPVPPPAEDKTAATGTTNKAPQPVPETPTVVDTPPAPQPPEPAGPDAKVVLASVRNRLKDPGLDKEKLVSAEEELATIKNPGPQAKEIENLAREIREERDFESRLTEAQSALDEDRLEDSKKALASSAGTKLFKARRDELQKKLQAAQVKATQPPPEPPVAQRPAQQPPPSVQPVSAGGSDNAALAKTALAEGKTLLAGKKNPEAITRFEKCLELDSTVVECQLYMGAAYARLGQMDKGAEYYRRFLKLAPDHPQHDKVAEMLEAYEATKKQK